MYAIFSIHPEFAMAIFQGNKSFEYRKCLIHKSVNKIFVYVTSPVKKIIGYFEPEYVLQGTVYQIWAETCHVAGITESEYFGYFKNAKEGIAIKIANATLFRNPIDPFACMSDFKPPQSFKYIESNLVESMDGYQ